MRGIINSLLINQYLRMLFVVCAVAWGLGGGESCRNAAAGDSVRTVVIDAGHGGHDQGARGSGGTMEKEVVLTLGRMLADNLKDRYRTVLTRTGDYLLDFADRAATANQVKADLFLSIHTGAGFASQTDDISVYYYETFPEQVFLTSPESPETSAGEDPVVPWEWVQKKHSGESAAFARLMKSQIDSGDFGMPAMEVRKGPLVALQGVNMPAVLVEIGTLTNADREKAFQDKLVLSGFVKSITRAIDIFFDKKGTILSTDLQE
jgi:N-acetylmuramoyl-L-alanine amidase